MRVPKQKTAWQQWGLSLVVLVVLADAVWVLLGHNSLHFVQKLRRTHLLAALNQEFSRFLGRFRAVAMARTARLAGRSRVSSGR